MNAGASFLKRLAGLLEECGIPYMVAGSWASTTFGTPRTTQDIDVVVDPQPAALDRFLGSLDAREFYVDPDTARIALRERGMFNVIHMTTGWKADLVIRKARPFSIREMARRRRAVVQGVEVYVASAEDTVVAKLEWSALAGGSRRQRDDVRGILRVQQALDMVQILEDVEELGLSAEWAAVQEPEAH